MKKSFPLFAGLFCAAALTDWFDGRIARARSLAGWYFRGVPNAAQWRDRAMHCHDAAEYLALADELRSSLYEELPEG